MILDTFYLLFRSDSKEAQKGVDELDKKVGSLTDKGKKRSEQENKDLKERVKQNKELNENLKETGNQYDNLTTKVAQVAAGYFSITSLAKGFLNTVNNNAALQNQADLLGKNSAELKAYGAAAKASGGSAEGVYGYAQSLFERFSSVGLKTPAISEVFSKIRAQLKQAGSDPSQREYVFQQFGVPQDLKTLLSLPDKEFDATIAKSQELTASIAEAGKVSKEFASIWANYEQTADDIATQLSSKLLPVVKSLYDSSVSNGRWWNNILSGKPGNFGDVPANNGTSSPGASKRLGSQREKDLAFWMAQGYTKEQAAAWVAASERESGGNPNAIGDNGKAHGLFQWHQPRRAAIFKGTGIDINNASREDQLKAAAWEAEQRGDAGLIKGAKTADGAAALHTRFFERPADIVGESMRRGQLALSIAGDSAAGGAGGGGKNISVKVGDVNIHTSATDSQGIASDISNNLAAQIHIAISNTDDGVKY